MVTWIASVSTASGIGVETRDIGVQILDAFLSELHVSVLADPLKNNGVAIIGLAAAAAIILASKVHAHARALSKHRLFSTTTRACAPQMHEQRPLCVDNFPHFEREQLLEFERRILVMIGFQIYPHATPSACVRHMLQLWSGPDADPDNHGSPSTATADDAISALADYFIGHFLAVGSESLKYAPSTVAMAALLLSFSKLKMDCAAWLQRLPDECFPPKPLSTVNYSRPWTR